MIAAQHGRQNCLHLLAARGAGLEGMDRLEGATVFHHACKKGWADLAEHLLVCGADPAAVDEKGLNGMNLAEAAAQEPVVQRLRDIALGGDHARLLAEISQPSSSMNPRGQVHALGSFTNDPTWLAGCATLLRSKLRRICSILVPFCSFQQSLHAWQWEDGHWIYSIRST